MGILTSSIESIDLDYRCNDVNNELSKRGVETICITWSKNRIGSGYKVYRNNHDELFCGSKRDCFNYLCGMIRAMDYAKK